MELTNVLLKYNGEWRIDEQGICTWCQGSDSKWAAITLDKDNCSCEEVVNLISKVLELNTDESKMRLSYLPCVRDCNPLPIYISNAIGLKTYLCFGDSQNRPVLHVELSKNSDVEIGRIIDAGRIENIKDKFVDVKDEILSCDMVVDHNEKEKELHDGYFDRVFIRDDASKMQEANDEVNDDTIARATDEVTQTDTLSHYVELEPIEDEQNMVLAGDNGYCFKDGSNLAIGQEFDTKEEVKNVLSKLAITASFEFDVVKSTKSLYSIKCVSDKCSWRVRVSKTKKSTRFSIRKYCNTHTCDLADRRKRHRQASADVVSNMLLENFRGQQVTPTPKTIMTMMQNRGINISYYMAWKGKEFALNKLRGDPDESFHMLLLYLNMVKQVNPSSITHLVVDDSNRFRYMFLAYGACISGYKFMRKVVAVDGTFLKGKYNGVFLVATAQDGEFHQFPIAWGVVDSETVESWTWFMLRLQEVVPDDEELVIISDRHQGIISAVANVYKQAHHGYCVWHLSQNIKTRSKQKGATELFMHIAYAYKQSEFDSLYSDMRKRYPQVAKYLEEHTSPDKWSRSHCPGTRYNIMTTNGVESINSRLRAERDLPIVSLLNALQKLTSCWFSRYRNAAAASTTIETPAVESILRERSNASQKHHVYELNSLQYHVYTQDDHEIVDFATNSSSCRVYDFDRIPCSHAIAASYAAKLGIYDLCSEYYTTRTRTLAYSCTIYHVPQCSEWTMTTDPLERNLLPPNVKRKRGRRKVDRNPSIGEFGKR